MPIVAKRMSCSTATCWATQSEIADILQRFKQQHLWLKLMKTATRDAASLGSNRVHLLDGHGWVHICSKKFCLGQVYDLPFAA